MAEELTLQQKQAVTNRGGKLLVSAAAGSGKTKVLVDRLLGYIMDPNDPANVDDFLIITYTKAAAAELRVKIAQKISERIADDPENRHLQKQLQRLYLAKISTVHSFCTDILRENAYRMDIPSDFRVSEERDSVQLQMEAIETVLNSAYANIHEDAEIHDFLDTQGLARNDRQIESILLSVYRSARCHLDSEAWMKWCEKQSDVADVDDPSETLWGRCLVENLHNALDLYIGAMCKCIERAENAGNMPAVVQLLNDTVQQMRSLRSLSTWDEIAGFKGIDFGRLTFPRKDVDAELCEQIKFVRKAIKDDIEEYLLDFADPGRQVLEALRSSGSSVRGLIKLVRQFGAEYERLKKNRRTLDFSDLEHRTLDLLLGKSRAGITVAAKEIGRRFREIMVDEYQDSNGVQDAIFNALTEERQNCFMVGDVKQSIYQFRLADPSIFIDKYNRFSPAEDATPGQGRKVMLSQNFRSGGGVIQAVNEVFVRSMSNEVGGLAYTENEMLYEGVHHEPLGEPEVEFYAVDATSSSIEEEAAFVAQRIAELTDGTHMVREGNALRPIKPSDIVILLRSPRTSGGYFQRALSAKGIFCKMGGTVDLLQTEEVSVLVSLLQTVMNPKQDIPLVATMASRVFGFTADDLAKLRSNCKDLSIYDALQEDKSCKVQSFLRLIEKMREASQLYSLSEFVTRIIDATNYMSVFFALPDGDRRCENIRTFCRIVADFACGAQRDLGQFLDYLHGIESDGILIESESTGSDAVTIMTIHSSKGLEYPVVFLSGLSRLFNKESIYQQVLCHKELGIGLNYVDTVRRFKYPTIAKRAIAAEMTAEAISEELRVLYVAMTRARDRLIMTYASTNLETKLIRSVCKMQYFPNVLQTSSVSCAGDWILQTALGKIEAGELFAIGGKPDETQTVNIPWLIRVVQAHTTDETVAVETEQEQIAQDAWMDQMERGLRFSYPFTNATVIPSKQTATQLKGRIKDQEVAEFADVSRPINFRRPSFADKVQSTTAKGDAVHKFMQFVRFDACCNEEGIRTELDRLLNLGVLSAEEVAFVNVESVLLFFTSRIGNIIRDGSAEVLREFKFSVLVDASEYYPSVIGEELLLQGVIDCAIVESDGIVIVDFKTDFATVETVANVVKRYDTQVCAYAKAIEKIYGLPVKNRYLYLMSLGEFVEI